MGEDTSRLLQRYRDAIKNKKEPYFDVNELEDLLEHFETEEEFASFKKLAALGRKLHPDNVIMKIQEARGNMFYEHYDEALALLNAINGGEAADDEDGGEIDLLKMECLCRLGQYDEVSKHLEELEKENCVYLQDAFETIAPILIDMCMDDEAFNLINHGMKLFHDSCSLKDDLDQLMEYVDADKAIEFKNKQIDEDPYDADNWNSAAQIYADKGDFGEAIEALCFASACDDSEPDPEMEMMKGLYYYMNENYKTAIEVYKKIKITPDMEEENMEIRSYMARCYVEMGESKEAYECLKDIVSDRAISDEPVDYLNFIQCCIETEHRDEIPNALDVANKKFPDDVNILSLLTATYMDIGRDKDSKDASKRLLKILGSRKELSSEDISIAFSTGRFFSMICDTEESLKYFNTVKRFQPDHPMLQFYMALTKMMDGTIHNFDDQYKQPLVQELQKRLKESGFDADKIKAISEAVAEGDEENRVIPSDELTKEFLRNEGNKN